MSLKRKIILYVNIIMIITLAIILFSIDNVMEGSRVDFLDKYASYRLKVISNYLKESSGELENRIYDNAYWDDLYYNLEIQNVEWLKENVTKYLYERPSFYIDILLLVKEDGSYIELYGENISFDDLKSTNVYKKTYDELTSPKNFMINKEYTIIDNTLYEIVAAPITANNITKMNGILFLGRAINKEFLARLSKYLILDHEEISIVKNKTNAIMKKNIEDIFEIYYPIKDINDNHLAYIKVVYDTSLFDEFKYLTFKKTMLYILLFSFISVLLGLYFVNKYIKKLERIIKQVNLVASGHYNNRLEEKGAAEVVNLLRSVNKLSEEIEKKMKEQHQSYLEFIKTLVTSIEVKDIYTKGHSERVSYYAYCLGEEIGYEKLDVLVDAGLMHDIGKIAIPDYILNKPEKLTDEEFDIIKTHPENGYKILDTSNLFEELKVIIKYHHEKYNGNGYPEGLSGQNIPIESRILAIVDTFDALTSDRAYRKALSLEEAMEIIVKESGSQFDPDIVKFFEKIVFDIYEELSEKPLFNSEGF